MKKLLFLPLLLIFLGVSSCKDNNSEPEAIKIETPDNNPTTSSEDHMEWPTEIDLNDGQRWEANPETTQGIRKMQIRIDEDSSSSIEEYYQLAADLNEVKNYIVEECTMKGEAHENLHVYMGPLLDNVKALGEAENIEEAEALKEGIRNHLKTYSIYFQ